MILRRLNFSAVIVTTIPKYYTALVLLRFSVHTVG